MMRKSIPESIHRVEMFIDFTVLNEFLRRVTKRVLKTAAEAKGLKVLKHNLNFIHPLLSQVSQDP